ncbi:uncharacterized protein LOC107365472 [Tetranychus urticae]|uniref:uncharacterized protein LOC107365472 n=1 Tax=Tetranychus urticae TaxID=32264 RepID=UPI00077BBB6D|nr:uncharacterized protein LOC107365472 [Tetranychus urticae]
MAKQDKITFKVKHLDKYHDIVIDWNDDRYVDKFQQIFEQLESITGVPSRYTSSVYIPRPDEVNFPGLLALGCINRKAYTPDLLPNFANEPRFCNMRRHIRDGDRFHLKYCAYYYHYVSKRISMDYGLVRESYVTEGVCSQDFCQHQCTESHFKRLKDLVSNDELNAKIAPLVQPLLERHLFSEADTIFREFSIQQYFHLICVEYRREEIEQNGDECQDYLYLRTRG